MLGRASSKEHGIRAQSGLEYLLTYGWALLIISIVVVLLYLYVMVPSHIIQSYCNFVDGAYCNDMIVGTNLSSHATEVAVFLSNIQKYPIVNPKLNIKIDNVSTGAYNCSPNFVLPGGSIICAVPLSIKTDLGTLVTGSMYLNALYCGLSKNYSINHNCSSAPEQVYSGYFNAHAVPLVSPNASISLSAVNYTNAANNAKDPLIATVKMLGYPLKGATVYFNESNTIYSLSPNNTETNAEGQALSYVWGMAKGNLTVYASYAGIKSNNVTIHFMQPDVLSFMVIGFPDCSSSQVPMAEFDGQYYTCSQLVSTRLALSPNSTHTYYFNGTTQAAPGMKGIFKNFTIYNVSYFDPTGEIKIISNATIVLYYYTQYLLSMSVSPSLSGEVSPSSSWYNPMAHVRIIATPNTTWFFSNWSCSGSGCYSGNSTKASITITNPINETANFFSTSTTTTTTTAPYVYCVGSSTYPSGASKSGVPPYSDLVYYAPITNTGIGSWTNTTKYPIPMYNASCSIYNGYIYCVGTSYSKYSKLTYYAPITSSGIGQWVNTTPYPVPIYNAGCSIFNGYIYCVGTAYSKYSKLAYYAPITSSGIGSWSNTTSYPIGLNGAGCSIYDGYIYCVGSYDYPSYIVYYAPITGTGIGIWTNTTSYPMGISDTGCTVYNGYLYCVGSYSFGSSPGTNLTYYAPLSSTGVGIWNETTNYPINMFGSGCIIHNGYIYCFGSASSYNLTQGTNLTYYAPITGMVGIGTWKSGTNYPIPFAGGSCQVIGSGGSFLGGGGTTNFNMTTTTIVSTSTTTSSTTTINPNNLPPGDSMYTKCTPPPFVYSSWVCYSVPLQSCAPHVLNSCAYSNPTDLNGTYIANYNNVQYNSGVTPPGQYNNLGTYYNYNVTFAITSPVLYNQTYSFNITNINEGGAAWFNYPIWFSIGSSINASAGAIIAFDPCHGTCIGIINSSEFKGSIGIYNTSTGNLVQLTSGQVPTLYANWVAWTSQSTYLVNIVFINNYTILVSIPSVGQSMYVKTLSPINMSDLKLNVGYAYDQGDGGYGLNQYGSPEGAVQVLSPNLQLQKI
ncbi:MAG: InlB B-repeat-containing protein [Candidatus Micrarchaeia archaeon]